jgi:hypothetical protein
MTGLHLGDSCQLHRRVDGLRPGRAEEHAAVGHWGDLVELVGELFGGPVRERIEAAVRGDLLHLGVDGIGDLDATVTDIAVPEAGHAIDELVTR